MNNPFKSILKALQFQKQTPNLLERVIARWIGFGTPVQNMTGNPQDYVQKGYMGNAFVYQAVDFIASKAARVPIKLYQVKANGEIDEIKAHPLLGLIKKPNAYQGTNEFTTQALGYKLITGNSYVYMPKLEAGANAGKPFELHVMPAHKVDIVTGVNWKEPIGGYKIQFAPDVTFTPSEVMHFRYPAYDWELGDFYGMSPLKPHINILNKDNSNTLAAKSSFDNGGAAGVLTDNKAGELGGMNAEQAKILNDKWTSQFTGAEKKNKILVTSANVTYHHIGLSPVDMNMLNDASFNRSVIMAAYHLSDVIFNNSSASTESNVKQARKAAWTDAIQPALDDYVSELNRVLTPLYGSDLMLKADYSGVTELQEDKASQVLYLKDAYWMTGSEKRAAMNLEYDALMDEYFLPSTLTPFEELPPMLDDGK